MADLAASAVTILDKWVIPGPYGKQLVALRAKATLLTMGSTTNKVPASVFGLTRVVMVQVAESTATAENRYIATPSQDGVNILFSDLETVSDVDRGAAADNSGTFNFFMFGYYDEVV